MHPFPTDMLANQVAVVTGGGSGIGRAIALALASAGADVLLHTRRNTAGAGEVDSAIEQMGRRCELIFCDLIDASQHSGFVENAWNWQGRVDIWVNNAGGDVLTGEAVDWSFEQKLNYLWQVDVTATIRLSRMIGYRMKNRSGGSILNMGWSQAEHGMAGDSGELFGAIKGAVTAFSMSLARSLAPLVRVNCLAPGWIKTKWGESASDYWQQRAVKESLLGRWGTAEDVAAAACYLLSPAAAFVTGQVLPVDGGLRQSE